MKLILVRHAQAGPYCADDAGRDLTIVGQKQAQQSAQTLLEKYTPELIICSPYNRARQTAEYIYHETVANGNIPKQKILNEITPDDDPVQALNSISRFLQEEYAQIQTVVVVCHMPIVAKMAALLEEQDLMPFELAEYRVFEAPAVAISFATLCGQFIPT